MQFSIHLNNKKVRKTFKAQTNIYYNNWYINAYSDARNCVISNSDVSQNRNFDFKFLNEEKIDFLIEQTKNNERDLEQELARIEAFF
jgi:hypothetical protein